MYQLLLDFEQVLTLVKQLPIKEKLKLSQELEKDTLDHKLTEILQSFQTNELLLETINEEVETVRSEIYSKKNVN